MKNDIEGLKQKLVVYKQTLETMKSGNVVEDYLLMKNECYNLIKQISKLENEMEIVKNQHEIQIKNKFQQVDNLKDAIKTIDLTIENVKQEVRVVTEKVNSLNLDELILKVEMLIRNGDSLATYIQEEKKELGVLKNELNELKNELLETKGVIKSQLADKTTRIKPTSYQQLRKIIQSSTSSQKSLSVLSEPFRKDISNFYQSISKTTHKVSFLPPTSTKQQKIGLVDQIKETTQNLEELKEAEKEPIVLNKTVEEQPVIVSENTNIPSSNEPFNLEDSSLINVTPNIKSLGHKKFSSPIQRNNDEENH